MLDDQIAELERSLAERPGDPGARVRLAELLTRAGRREEAAQQFLKVLGRDPTDLNASRSLIGLTRNALAEKGRYRRVLDTDRVWRPADEVLIVPVTEEKRVRTWKQWAIAVGFGLVLILGWSVVCGLILSLVPWQPQLIAIGFVIVAGWQLTNGRWVSSEIGNRAGMTFFVTLLWIFSLDRLFEIDVSLFWVPIGLGPPLLLFGWMLYPVADVALALIPGKNMAFLFATRSKRVGRRGPGMVDLREVRIEMKLNPEIDDAPQRLVLELGSVRAVLKQSTSRREIVRYAEMFDEFLARGGVEGYDEAVEMIRRSDQAGPAIRQPAVEQTTHEPDDEVDLGDIWLRRPDD